MKNIIKKISMVFCIVALAGCTFFSNLTSNSLVYTTYATYAGKAVAYLVNNNENITTEYKYELAEVLSTVAEEIPTEIETSQITNIIQTVVTNKINEKYQTNEVKRVFLTQISEVLLADFSTSFDVIKNKYPDKFNNAETVATIVKTFINSTSTTLYTLNSTDVKLSNEYYDLNEFEQVYKEIKYALKR